MPDRLYINEKNKELIEKWKTSKVFDFDESVSNIDFFILAASLGISDPKPIENRYGFVREEYIKSYENALLVSMVLGSIVNEDEIDRYIDPSVYFKKAENCAENGFSILKEKIDRSNADNDLLCNQLLQDLDYLYEVKVNK